MNTSMEHLWSDTDRRNQKYSKKMCPSVIFSTTNFARTGLGSNPDLRDEMPATDRLSRGTGLKTEINLNCIYG